MPRKKPTRYMESTRWAASFKPFGDRLDFLSPEQAQLNTGRLRILPARGDKTPFKKE